ncbi:MAG: hypothetical protein ACI8RD_006915 [Bacillariaceae sp.]|jgi:hypothetical protein
MVHKGLPALCFFSKLLSGSEDFLCGYSTKDFHHLVVFEAEKHGKIGILTTTTSSRISLCRISLCRISKSVSDKSKGNNSSILSMGVLGGK